MRFPWIPAVLVAIGVVGVGHYMAKGVLSHPTYSTYLPNPDRTPGVTLPVAAAQVCRPGYSRQVRNVPDAEKRAVYQEYGMEKPPAGQFEVDHLISLELGGSNDLKNLWPQSYLTQPWNAHVKDALENELHREVCAGRLTLAEAQTEIRSDWIAAYRTHFHTDFPPPAR